MKKLIPFDDFLLNRTDNTRRIFQKPCWQFDCAFSDPLSPRMTGGQSVVRAPQGGYYLMYYGIPDEKMDCRDENLFLCLAHSEDGLHFSPYPVHPEKEKFAHVLGRVSETIGGFPYEDVHESDPARRYKSVCARFGDSVQEPGKLLFSPDCVHWQALNDVNVTPSYVDCATPLLYNPYTRRYQVTTRRRMGERRICLVESDETFQNWTEPRCILHPQPWDEPTTHLYGMPQFYDASADLFIGFLWRMTLPFASVMAGSVVSEYVYSYDGLNWNRTNASVSASLPRGQYGSGSVYAFGMIPRETDILVYANMFPAEHQGTASKLNRPDRIVVPGILPRDRYVCIDSGKGKAMVQTQKMRLNSPDLFINCRDPFGTLKARLLNGDRPFDGYDFDDFIPIPGDHSRAPLRWKDKDLSFFADTGEWFTLQIAFEQAEIYALEGDFSLTINTHGPVYERF